MLQKKGDVKRKKMRRPKKVITTPPPHPPKKKKKKQRRGKSAKTSEVKGYGTVYPSGKVGGRNKSD